MNERGRRKVRTGLVVSDKMEKTIVVKVERRSSHSVFNKVITLSKRFKAHDERNECKTGDKVSIVETRPLSKDKRWRLQRVLEKKS